MCPRAITATGNPRCSLAITEREQSRALRCHFQHLQVFRSQCCPGCWSTMRASSVVGQSVRAQGNPLGIIMEALMTLKVVKPHLCQRLRNRIDPHVVQRKRLNERAVTEVWGEPTTLVGSKPWNPGSKLHCRTWEGPEKYPCPSPAPARASHDLNQEEGPVGSPPWSSPEEGREAEGTGATAPGRALQTYSKEMIL